MSRSAGSTPSEIENLRLREEVRFLRDELRQLTVRVDRQEDRLSEVTDSLSVISAVQSFDVVSSASAATPATDQSARVVRDSDLSDTGPYTWTFREEVAKEIGEFLKRSLQGQHRGESGRDKIKGLQNRLYIVARDAEGKVYNPALVLKAFQRVKTLCYKNGSWGDSIFVGLPSYTEASIAVHHAGLQWPTDFQ
jgi:hypothetical protein